MSLGYAVHTWRGDLFPSPPRSRWGGLPIPFPRLPLEIGSVLRCQGTRDLLSALTRRLCWRYCRVTLSLGGAEMYCDLNLAMKVNKRNSEFADSYSIKPKLCFDAYCKVVYYEQRLSNADIRENLTSVVAPSNLPICFSGFAHMSAP